MSLTEFMEEIERDFPGCLEVFGRAPFEEAWRPGATPTEAGVEAANAGLFRAFGEERPLQK